MTENALKIDEPMLEKAHEIARRNYLCGKREALKVIEDIKAEIEKAFAYFENGDTRYGFQICLDIIDKHIKGVE